MFDPQSVIEWPAALLWLLGIAVAAFLVSWIFTDVRHGRRRPYVGVLAATTAALTAGYLLWSGSGAAFWTTNWPWGIVAAILAGAFLAAMIFRAPAPFAGQPALNGPSAVWEGLVYGTAEGLLLSVLPVVATWHMFYAIEWTDGWRAGFAATAAIAASVVVIATHHLGYREYRGRAMGLPIVGCTVLSIAYLISVNPIAAMGGHTILHLAILRRGLELPPHERSAPIGHEGGAATQGTA